MTFLPALSSVGAPSANPLWFVCTDGAVLLRREARALPPGAPEGVGLLPAPEEVRGLGLDPAEALYLGRLAGEDCFAAAWDKHAGQLPDSLEAVGLRKLWGRLDGALFPIAGRATQLVEFAQTHRFCGRCGARTRREEKERAVSCASCGLSNWPRISPAIITLVRRGDEGLLARSARFAGPYFSTLAGFSEVGETLEQTLAREVREEVGVEVSGVRYFGSQPWPFPHSLMIAFQAEYAGGEVRVDGEEILEARFFRADALPLVPPRLSIARRLIDAWVRDVTGHDVPDSASWPAR
jgi:NAD+ diphosphatase